MKLHNYANDYALCDRLRRSMKTTKPIREVENAVDGDTGAEIADKAPQGGSGTTADNQGTKAKKAPRKAKVERDPEEAL